MANVNVTVKTTEQFSITAPVSSAVNNYIQITPPPAPNNQSIVLKDKYNEVVEISQPPQLTLKSNILTSLLSLTDVTGTPVNGAVVIYDSGNDVFEIRQITFGDIDTSSNLALSGTLTVGNTTINSAGIFTNNIDINGTPYTVLFFNANGAITSTGVGTEGTVLQIANGVPVFDIIDGGFF